MSQINHNLNGNSPVAMVNGAKISLDQLFKCYQRQLLIFPKMLDLLKEYNNTWNEIYPNKCPASIQAFQHKAVNLIKESEGE